MTITPRQARHLFELCKHIPQGATNWRAALPSHQELVEDDEGKIRQFADPLYLQTEITLDAVHRQAFVHGVRCSWSDWQIRGTEIIIQMRDV